MFSEPSWDVEDDVKVVSENIVAQREKKDRTKNHKMKIKKDKINNDFEVEEQNPVLKKSKNKYKALNEEQKKLVVNLKKANIQIQNKSKSSNEKINLSEIVNKIPKNIESNKKKDNEKLEIQSNKKVFKNNELNSNLNKNNDKIAVATKEIEPLNDHVIKNSITDKIQEKKSLKRKLNRLNRKNKENNLVTTKKSKLCNIIEILKENIVEKESKHQQIKRSNVEEKSNNIEMANKKGLEIKSIKPTKKEKNVENKYLKKEENSNIKPGKNENIEKSKKVVLKSSKSPTKPITLITKTKPNNLDRKKLQKLLQMDTVNKKQMNDRKNNEISSDNKTQGYDKSGIISKNKIDSGEGNNVVLSKGKTLNDKMLARLESARFRYLNEHLYTTSSEEAVDLFKQDPQSFHAYHEGFTNQVEKWSMNPVDLMVKYINEKSPSLKVADFGCGDAKLAAGICNKEVHSFDLVAINDRVTVADIKRVPLKASSMDIVVFCLSLMGTNLNEYLAEANRVLKIEGILLIAEVVSRFEKIGAFIKKLNKLGFYLLSKNDSNKMFVWFELRKMEELGEKEKLVSINLAPCVYKRR